VCGIAGAIGNTALDADAVVERMSRRMVPRGPDDAGIERQQGDGRNVVLGSRRLAIVDLSDAGHQPMVDPDRGTMIAFNGMIYNYRELRSELEARGERFFSTSDTEVILRAYGCFGERSVERLRGMFAFAIWDPEREDVLLARDRLGIKPLYYYRAGDTVLFASQVKALLASGAVPQRLSPEAIESFLVWGAVAEPRTAIKGVRSLPAGHLGRVTADGVTIQRYWEIDEDSPARPLSADEACHELRAHLQDAVRSHLEGDVEVGVFLSGGVDSSILAAAAAREAPTRAVSVAFADHRLDEERFARAVAERLGLRHEVVRLESGAMIDSLPAAFDAMDQPSFDGMNTFVVSQAAASLGLKVALSGLGADELFDGYGYAARMRRMETALRMPAPLRRLAGLAPRPILGGRAEKLRAWARAGPPRNGSAYLLLRRVFLDEDLDHLLPDRSGIEPAPGDGGERALVNAARLDLENYTRNVLLRDTDAMSMAHSLEVRVPYLDHRLVEWALTLPDDLVVGRRKALLIDAVGAELPPEVRARSKHGFALPLSEWMRGPLRGEVGAALTSPDPGLEAIVSLDASLAIWRDFLGSGHRWVRAWALFALGRWVESLRILSPGDAGPGIRQLGATS
jgi:asparagine synthase (glutamine-hydrolysing)